MNSLRLVESMHDLSCQMVKAAEANAWSRLAELETRFAGLRNQLALQEPNGRQSEILSAEERARKASMIDDIQAHVGLVRKHVDPWMNSVRKLLSGNAQGRRMRAAYRAFGG